MKNRAAKYFGMAALLAQVFVFYGCSSGGGSADGTGGAVGGGTGGSTAAGGSTGSSTDPSAYTPMGDPCPSTVKNKGACVVGTDQACFNTCGPLKSGIKNCACTAGMWNCPICGYDPSKDYSCYTKPTTAIACPPDPAKPADPSGMMLPQSGDACTLPTCQPCGSGSGNAYRDSGGTPKIGFCVCSSVENGTYSCASINEWPPV